MMGKSGSHRVNFGQRGSSQHGSALIIGVLTMWLIIYSISMVGKVSQTVGKKIKAQMAADTAALAGAQIMANNLSTIAWINDSRAMLHYYKVRYGADVAAAGVLGLFKANLAVTNEPVPLTTIDDGKLTKEATNDFIGDFIKTFDAFTEVRYAPWEEANTEHWATVTNGLTRQIKGQNYEEQLARIQHSIGIITKTMVEKEVYDKAAENGSQLSCFFPEFEMMPEPESSRYIIINSIDTTERDASGNIVNTNGWRLHNDEIDFTARSIGEDVWEIDYIRNGHEVHVIMDKDAGDGWITVDVTETGQPDQHLRIHPESGIIISGDLKVQIEQLEDGSTKITQTQNGTTTSFRYKYEDGLLWIYDPDTGEFYTPNKNSDDENYVMINGTKVRVEDFQNFDIGSMTFWLDRVHIGDFIVYYQNPVRIVSTLYGFNTLAENDEVRVNGLSTKSADCRWSRVYYWHNQSDRVRHRMCTEVPGEQWRYEIKKEGSYLDAEMAEADPEVYDRYSEIQGKTIAGENHEQADAWEDLFDLRTGKPTVDDVGRPIYDLTRECWHPHDKYCSISIAQHIELGISYNDCTPIPGKGNGWYHDKNGARIECFLGPHNNVPCINGKVTIGLNELQSGSAIPTISSYSPNPIDPEHTELINRLQDYPTIINSIQRAPKNLPNLPPLILKEEYFKYGISVGVYISGDNALGYEGPQTLGAPGEEDAFTDTQDGVYAFAAARAGFRNPDTNEYQFSFSDNLQRQDWLSKEDNLYLADWAATLVPLSTQIRDEDIEAAEDLDSGLTYLLRRFSTNNWRATFFSRNQGINLRINRFDLNSLENRELIQH